MGDDTITLDEIKAVATNVGIHDFIMSLPSIRVQGNGAWSHFEYGPETIAVFCESIIAKSKDYCAG